MTRLNLLLLIALLAAALYLVRVATTRGACSPSSTGRRSQKRQLEPDYERLQTEKQSQATPLRVEAVARDAARHAHGHAGGHQYVTYARAGASAGRRRRKLRR